MLEGKPVIILGQEQVDGEKTPGSHKWQRELE